MIITHGTCILVHKEWLKVATNHYLVLPKWERLLRLLYIACTEFNIKLTFASPFYILPVIQHCDRVTSVCLFKSSHTSHFRSKYISSKSTKLNYK
jgi:hypothetical protein